MKPEFTLKLLSWHESDNDRVMPWKGERDPYRIWLSEIILQQTRVEQGLRYYERFIKQFPNVHALASADEQVVFKLWEGLGYYTRCRNLIASAKIVSGSFNGIFPNTYDEILSLKGIGPYTAAAISSFAFNLPYAVVDGNVQRVISRYFGINTPVNTSAGKQLYQELAQALLDENAPALFNQAIMDFGATICKPQQPLCEICVQRNDCEAYKYQLVKQLPVKEKSIIKKNRWFNYVLIRNGTSILLRQRSEKDIWQNLHEFVLFESRAEPDAESVQRFVKQLLKGSEFILAPANYQPRQVLSHQVIHGRFYEVRINGLLPQIVGYEAISVDRISLYAFPQIINSYLKRHDEE